ncbi:odorant receptor 10-like [Xylocopa sonorina]|uniref:odorant receptor 10-like n=1 Tax=Xylocopa sonorina TaxID=1818115 RepID=UPI00403B2EA7
MKASFEKDFAYAMAPLKILSWPVGTWPLQDYDAFSGVRAIFAVLVLLLMMAIVQTELYLDINDAEKNLDALVVITCGILAVAKVIYFRVWPAGLVANFTSAVTDYEELRDKEKRVILRRHARMGRMACVGVICFSYGSSTLFMAATVFAEEEESPVNVTRKDTPDYPIPSENTLAIVNVPDNLFVLVFVVEYMMLLLTSTGNLGSDSLFFGIAFHLCGQVEVLRLEFSKLDNENGRAIDRFVVLIKRHIYLLNLAEMLNGTVSTVLIVQLFSSCILICTSGFQFILALSVGNVVLVIKTFVVASTLLVQLFAYSYVGDYLTRRMRNVANSAYSCGWYDLPKNVPKDIIYVIMRAQDPVQLTAGKFFIVNMETYMSILKTSMSYLSVLRVMVNT